MSLMTEAAAVFLSSSLASAGRAPVIWVMCAAKPLTWVVRSVIMSAKGLPEPRFAISLPVVVGAAAEKTAKAGRAKREKRMVAFKVVT